MLLLTASLRLAWGGKRCSWSPTRLAAQGAGLKIRHPCLPLAYYRGPALDSRNFLASPLNQNLQTADCFFMEVRSITARRRHRRWDRPSVFVVCQLVLLWGVSPAAAQGGRQTPLKIGFQNSPPYHFPDAAGGPAGPAVDLLRAAAAREGIPLEWVFAPDGPEKALVSGQVDLWPLMAYLPERRKFLYITAPWSRMGYAMVFPRALDIRQPSDLAGKTVAATLYISSDRHTADKFFPNSPLLAERTVADVMSAVCSGAAAGGLLSLNSITVAHHAPCAQRDLRVQPLDGANYWFGIGARKESLVARSAADRLREAIGRLAEEGALVDIDFRWNSRITGEALLSLIHISEPTRQAEISYAVFCLKKKK